MNTDTIEQVTDQALKLPSSARAYLAERLLESLDQEEDFEVSEAWLNEAKRRAREIDSGATTTIPGADALSRLRSQFAK